jgi:hypothetical protein
MAFHVSRVRTERPDVFALHDQERKDRVGDDVAHHLSRDGSVKAGKLTDLTVIGKAFFEDAEVHPHRDVVSGSAPTIRTAGQINQGIGQIGTL